VTAWLSCTVTVMVVGFSRIGVRVSVRFRVRVWVNVRISHRGVSKIRCQVSDM